MFCCEENFCFCFYEATMCFFFLRYSDTLVVRWFSAPVCNGKLFVDSGVNLGGNDSLFSTSGKYGALKKKEKTM